MSEEEDANGPAALEEDAVGRDRYVTLARVHCDYADEDLALLERSRELARDLYAKVGAHNIHEARARRPATQHRT